MADEGIKDGKCGREVIFFEEKSVYMEYILYFCTEIRCIVW